MIPRDGGGLSFEIGGEGEVGKVALVAPAVALGLTRQLPRDVDRQALARELVDHRSPCRVSDFSRDDTTAL
jgi:hypothetical protein